MRVPVWYVLASDGSPLHRHMAIISATVLRRIDPGCSINLLCDKQSADAASRCGVELTGTFDRVEIGDEANPSPMYRSRAMKLRLPLDIGGALLYVDSDTLAVAPLNDFPTLSSSVMFAFDYQPGQRVHRGAPGGATARFAQIGWPLPVPRYFNGGVSVWRDDAPARRFAERWFKNWSVSVEAGVPFDQPALAHTDRELGGVVGVLPAACNAQVSAWAGFARGAMIWHFWHSQVQSVDGPATVLEQLLETYATTAEVDFDVMDRARRSCFPWVRSQGMLPYLQTGNYGAAVRELPSVVSRLFRRGSGTSIARP